MWFDIIPNSKNPIFMQIVSQVIFNIASGGVAVGDLIPSVRKLAEELSVHPNTVARAFQELERMGVVAERRGRGMEVTPDAPKICQAERHQRVGERIREALREALSSGLSAEEIRRLVDDEIGRGMGKRRE
ncbi:MAG TPA: GntR family transcriptional regulator [Gemmataceae bacterium]|nr:GntR family transcriptional regulator [Gemmataceae bacterium]